MNSYQISSGPRSLNQKSIVLFSVLILGLGLCGGSHGLGIIDTYAGTGSAGFSGDGSAARSAMVNYPSGVYGAPDGKVYFADYINHRVRVIDTDGTISTIAGNGTPGYSGDGGLGPDAMLNYPRDVVADSKGNVFIADMDNDRIRMVDKRGNIRTVAGTGVQGFGGDNGPAVDALLNEPTGLAVAINDDIYICDRWNHRIRKLEVSTGIITTVVGSGLRGYKGDNGPALLCEMRYPCGVDIDQYGQIFIADTSNEVIRKVDTDGIIRTIAGQGGAPGYSGNNGLAKYAYFNEPWDVAVGSNGYVYIADMRNHQVRVIRNDDKIYVVAGYTPADFPGPCGEPNDNCGGIAGHCPAWGSVRYAGYYIPGCCTHCRKGHAGDRHWGTIAPLYMPYGVAVIDGKHVFIADTLNQLVRKITNDTTPPALTLLGLPEVYVTFGGTYVESGIAAWDTYDGDVSASMTFCVEKKNPDGTFSSVGKVDTLVLGEYRIEYSAIDTAMNWGKEIYRTVTVGEKTPPEITILGSNPISVPVLKPYVDAGATAYDNYYGDITNRIQVTNTVNSSLVGNYTVTYNVSDNVGNAATPKVRTVRVRDWNAPDITVLGKIVVMLEVDHPYVDSGATAYDEYDGDLTDDIHTVNSVIPQVLGIYYVTYNVSDAAGNPATHRARQVRVVDTVPPFIVMSGQNDIQVNVNSSYTDAGAQAFDNYDNIITDSIVVTNPVDTSTPGTYIVRYNVNDSSGNPAPEVTRRVHVLDGENPTITLIGGADITAQGGFTYFDPGAIAFDNVDGDISSRIRRHGFVDTSKLNSFTLRFNVSDSSENPAPEVLRQVQVIDTRKPTITVVGLEEVSLEQHTPYVDQGATATDRFYGNMTDRIVTVNPVDTALADTYEVTYDVTDPSGNIADQVIRRVIVADTTPPVITLYGVEQFTLECGLPYPEPGFSAFDNVDGDITAEVLVEGAELVIGPPGTYTVTYSVSDEAGNEAIVQSRTVFVGDSKPPLLTLDTCLPTVLNCGETYVEKGAIAIDQCEGDISDRVVIGGDVVDSAMPGKYIITYNVSDNSGNVAREISRIVIVLLCEAPDPIATFALLCGPNEDLLAQLDLIRSTLVITHDDFDRDGMDDDINLRLMRHAVCTDLFPHLSDASLEVLALNQYLLELETHSNAYAPYKDILALMLSLSSPLQEKVVEELYDWGIPLDFRYAVIKCTSDACMASKGAVATDCPREVFHGQGDPDADGTVNLDELTNVMDGGYGIEDFIFAALDPTMDGKEVLTPMLSAWPQPDYDFGILDAGTTESYNFTLTNTGTGLLQGEATLTGAPEYSITAGADFILERGASSTVTVQLSPGGAGTFVGKLRLTGGSNGLVKIGLGGAVEEDDVEEKSDASCGSVSGQPGWSFGDSLLFIMTLMAFVVTRKKEYTP